MFKITTLILCVMTFSLTAHVQAKEVEIGQDKTATYTLEPEVAAGTKFPNDMPQLFQDFKSKDSKIKYITRPISYDCDRDEYATFAVGAYDQKDQYLEEESVAIANDDPLELSDSMIAKIKAVLCK